MIHRLLLVLLIGGCVLFGAVVAVELEPESETDAVVAEVKARAPTAPGMNRPQAPRLDEMVGTILARPLFVATRRPPQSAAPGAAADDLTDARLAGIVTLPGHRFAIFAINGEKPLRVAEGDAVSGWRIESITPREVSLTGPGGTKTLQPKLDPNLVPPAPVQPVLANAGGRVPTPPVPGAPRLPAQPGVAPPAPGVPVGHPGPPPRRPRVRQ